MLSAPLTAMASHPAYVRFGPFVCDTRTGELWKAGRPIRLQEQPRRLLAALLQQPGEVVSRDHLRRCLWPDDTFVDFDNALNVGIRRIREALGDEAPTARYVETVRGQGYRFIAPVLPAGSADPPPAATPILSVSDASAAAASSQARWPPALVVVGIVGLIAALSAAFSIVRSEADESRLESLAVLRFDNLLGDDDRQYLIDGLSEAIRHRLSTGRDLHVIASESAFAVTDGKAPPSELARRLGVEAVLTGSVAEVGTGVVINLRLTNGRNNRIRWAGRFERSLDELRFPDEIVDAVVSSIGGVITPARADARPAVVPEARDAYLRGRFFWAKRGEANSVTAVRYLSTAIQLQPDYAEAWAGLADVYAVYLGEPSPVIVPWPGDSVEGGLLAAQEALRLAPDLGEAHAALGKLYVARRRWDDAERSFARAVELSPQYTTARQWYGTMFGRLRRCDEALEQVTLGARLDPITVLVNEAVGSVYLTCGEPERALEMFDAVLVMHPTAHTTQHRRSVALVRLGRYDDAIRELQALAVAAPSQAVTAALAVAHAKTGRGAIARALLSDVTSPYLRAQIFSALGDANGMWSMLEESLGGQATALQNLLAEREFDRHRDDPRFVDFARRAGFPMPIRDARFSAGSAAVTTARSR